MKRTPVVVGVSGAGRSLSNLLQLQDQSKFKVVGVFSNKPKCKALEIAKNSGVQTFCSSFDSAQSNHQVLEDWLLSLQTEWIVLAGFLKKMPSLHRYQQRCINIHPSLLPKYGGPGMYGMRVHKAVCENHELLSGASIHFVTEIYDEGQVISQVEIPLHANDQPEEIAQKVFAGECRLLPETLNRLISQDLPLPKNQIFRLDFQHED